MKAIQFTRFGAPDVLELIDAPTPKATDGNALVQISAAALSMAAPRGRVVEIASIVNARYPLARSKEAYAAAKRGSQGRIVLMP